MKTSGEVSTINKGQANKKANKQKTKQKIRLKFYIRRSLES